MPKQFNLKHGECRGGTQTVEIKAWQNMRTRCKNPNTPYYKSYGQIGISISDEWDSFEKFLTDMGRCPSGMTLDRIDNSKGYCKENCRWASRKDQASNRRTNRLISIKGRTQTVTQWAEELCVKPSTIFNRLIDGWNEEMAVLMPVRKKIPHHS